MWEADGKRFLSPQDGQRILDAAERRGLPKQENFAQVVSPGTKDPARQLRNVLTGNTARSLEHPLSDPYATKIAKALGCSWEQLFRIIAGDDNIAASNYASFTRFIPLPASLTVDADQFFNGCRPSEMDLEAGCDIMREAYTKEHGIRSHISSLVLLEHPLRALGVIGVGGAGKSTLLRRAAYDLAKQGHLVLELNRSWMAGAGESVTQQLKRACGSSARTVVIVIDDIAEHVGESSLLPGMLRELDRYRILILFGEHPDRWPRVLRSTRCLIPEDNCWLHFVHRLSPSECERLVDRIMVFEERGLIRRHCDLSRSQRLELCHNIAQLELVVAMLQMRHGKPFQRIIENEYDQIPDARARDAYALICCCETFHLAPSESLIFRIVRVETSADQQQFSESTKGLLEYTESGITSRNRVIARTVARYSRGTPALRKAVFVDLFSHLDYGSPIERALFFTSFTEEGFPERITLHLAHDRALVRDFYREITSKVPQELKKYLLTSQGIAERRLPEPDLEQARECFGEAIALDPAYEFAHRQMAWLESNFNTGNADLAATYAIKAVELAPLNVAALKAAATILTFSTVERFPQARQYWIRALELNPADPYLIDGFQNYTEIHDRVFVNISGLKKNDLIPEYVWKELRPSFVRRKAFYGTKHKETIYAAKGYFKGKLLNDAKGSIAELQEDIRGIDLGRDRVLKGLYLANIARFQFVLWRHQNEGIAVTDIDKLFQDAIALNPEDPFAHSYYGTLLKDGKGDYIAAEKEYRLAIELSKKSRSERDHEHPLLLNNLALLIIDDVVRKGRKPTALKEAHTLLTKAVRRVEDMQSDFFWPKHSLDYCESVMGQANADTPK